MPIPKDNTRPSKKIVWVSEENGISFWEDEDGHTYLQYEDTQSGG